MCARRELPAPRGQTSADIGAICAGAQQRPYQQLHAHRGVTSLDFRHARLTRTESLRELFLRYVELLSKLTQFSRKRQFHFHELRINLVELEKVLRITNSPTRCFQSLPLVSSHIYPSFVTRKNCLNRFRAMSITDCGVFFVFFPNTSRITTASAAT